jgi:hypothetical protein
MSFVQGFHFESISILKSWCKAIKKIHQRMKADVQTYMGINKCVL